MVLWMKYVICQVRVRGSVSSSIAVTGRESETHDAPLHVTDTTYNHGVTVSMGADGFETLSPTSMPR